MVSKQGSVRGGKNFDRRASNARELFRQGETCDDVTKDKDPRAVLVGTRMVRSANTILKGGEGRTIKVSGG